VPTFYPISIVPAHFQWIININPLYSFLLVFRGFMYEGAFAPGWAFAVMTISSIVALAVGVWVFSRSWKNLVVLL
jgi:ABC-type polysaccharide/polyol phosphate export permease